MSKENKSKTWNYKLLFFSIYVCIIFSLERLISDRMYSKSFPLIKSLQQHPQLVSIMEVIAFLGTKYFKFILFCLIFSLCNYYYSFLFVLNTFSALFFSAIMKIMYQEPRPFWQDPDIVAYNCETGYGYPSNHVQATIPAYLSAFIAFYYRFGWNKSKHSQLIYYSGQVLLFIFFVLVAISRLVVGVHSLDQIIFGFFIGYGVYYFYFHILDYHFCDFNSLIEQFNYPIEIHRFVVVYLIVYMVYLTCLFFNTDNTTDDWLRVIQQKCNKTPRMTPYYKCLIDSTDYFAILGALLGMIYDVKINYGYDKLEDVSNDRDSRFIRECLSEDLEDNISLWNHVSFIKGFLIYLMIYAYFEFVYWFFPYLVENTTNIIFLYFGLKALPAFCLTFGVFSNARYITQKLNLANKLL